MWQSGGGLGHACCTFRPAEASGVGRRASGVGRRASGVERRATAAAAHEINHLLEPLFLVRPQNSQLKMPK